MTQTSDLYSSKKECCGCEACVTVCPTHIIHMKNDYDGFLYPEIESQGKCINCKRCIRVCPLKNPPKLASAYIHYGGYSKSDDDIKKSASGGVATVLSQYFIKNGGIVYGVSYSDDYSDIKYVRCDTFEMLEKLRGSKYAQAEKGNIFDILARDLSDKKVLFIGLPCEVNAVKNLHGKNINLYTIALICHGPTSPSVHRQYIQQIQCSECLTYFSVRYKYKGWKPYFIKAEFNNNSNFIEEFHKSTYGIAFRELKRPSCGECPFKLNYEESTINADLIIGDYHGATPNDKCYNPWGTSQISILTEKGEYLFKFIQHSFVFNKLTPRQAIHYNKALHSVIKPRWNRNEFACEFASKGLKNACNLWSIKFIDAYISMKKYVYKHLSQVKKTLFSRL